MRDLDTPRVRTTTSEYIKGRSRWHRGYVNLYGWATRDYACNSAGYPGTPTEYESKITKDNVTENFASKTANGDIIMNDFESVRSKLLSSIPASGQSSAGAYYGDYAEIYVEDCLPTTHLFPTSFPSWVSLDSDIDRLVARLHAQISKAPQQLLVTAAEFKKTMGTVKRSCNAARSIMKKVRNGTILKKRRKISLAQLTEIYLEARYGIRPIYYDIKNAFEALDAIGKPKRARLVVSDTGSKWSQPVGDFASILSASSPGDTGSKSSIDFNVKSVNHIDRWLQAGAILDYKFHTEKVYDVLGLDEILESGLELIPFSFIANWFLNLTDWLASWTPDYGVSVKGTWITLNEQILREMTLHSLNIKDSSVPGITDISGGRAVTEMVRKRRLANPDVSWHPHFRGSIDLSIFKWLDLAAIFGSDAIDFRRWKI